MPRMVPVLCCLLLPCLASAGLPEILQIDWQRMADIPSQGGAYGGFQDSDGGWLDDDSVFTAFGYSGGGAFHNTSFSLNITSGHWEQLPSAPVSGRQEVASTMIDGAHYFVGGFSYTAPYTYRDVLRFEKNTTGQWSWSSLPQLPYPLCSMGVASVGSRLYVSGGGDYDSKAFYVATDRNGENKGLGKRLLMLDTKNITAGWQRMPDIPGTPRFCHAFSPVASKLVVLGGSLPNGSSVVDNWSFDTSTSQWERLPDLPTSSSNFQTNGAASFMDRYVMLIGGYQFEHVQYPNGTVGTPFGQSQRMCPTGISAAGCRKKCAASPSILDVKYMGGDWSQQYNNDIFVFDVATSTFGVARGVSSLEPDLMPTGCGAFPIDDNLPQANIRGEKVFAIGGESNDRQIKGEKYTHYPQLSVVGHITVL